MPTTYTPLRYPGGKSAYANLLSNIICLNHLQNVVLVEPYAGGAGASLKLLVEQKVSRLILNDLDPAIYAFWWSALHATDALIERIASIPVTIEEWRRQRDISKSKDTHDLLSLGVSTLYMNRCNRSGILTANPIGGINQSGTYKIDARFNRNSLIKKIMAIAERSSQIEIHNTTCERLLTGFKKRKNTSNLLVYLDPPYYQKGPSLYLNHYEKKDHIRLANIILSCNFNWVLSYDSHEEIQRLYASVPMYESQLRYTILGNVAAHELVATRLKVPSFLKSITRR